MGSLSHGSYTDDCEGMSIGEINHFYGFNEDGEPYSSDNDGYDDMHDSESEIDESESDKMREIVTKNQKKITYYTFILPKTRCLNMATVTQTRTTI